MITVYHGEDIVASRKALPENSLKIDGKEVTPELFAQYLDGQDLFGTGKTIVIENPKKLPENLSGNIILWFDHKLTASQLKSFPGSKVTEFKISPVVFKFVESIRPGNQKEMLALFRQYLAQEAPEIIFSMIIRQFRLMLKPEDLAPWQQSRIKSQAKHFGQEKLKEIYKKLLNLDYGQKSGNSPVDLSSSLELFLLSL